MDTELQIVVEQAGPRFLAIRNDSAAFAREAGFAMQLLAGSTYLAETARKDKNALMAAVTNIAAVGLSLNPVTRHAYLVPRKNKVCLDIGAAGFVELARKGGLRDLYFGVVHECDTFTVPDHGQRVRHEYDPFSDRGEWKGAYCQHVYMDGTAGQCVTMSRAEIEKRRAMSETFKKAHGGREYKPCGSCIWCQWPEEMILKTVLRYARRWWPATPELDAALTVTGGDFDPGADPEAGDEPTEGGALCLSADQVKAIRNRSHEAGLPVQTICDRLQVPKLENVEAVEFGAIMARIADFETRAAARKAALESRQ